MSALEILAAWCGASLALVAVWCAVVEVGRRVTARQARRVVAEALHAPRSARARTAIDGAGDDAARIDFDWPDTP